jgi:hypothetical protein
MSWTFVLGWKLRNYEIFYACCNRNGKQIRTFKDENLQNPRVVTYDDEGHVYVTGRWSNNVIAISPDGRQSKVLLSKAEGLDCQTLATFNGSDSSSWLPSISINQSRSIGYLK